MQREQLEAWLAEGLSLDQIGRRVGRHPSTVAYWLAKHGLTPAHRARHAARGGIPRDLLAGLVADGLTTRQIAAALDRSQTNVRYWLRRHGIDVARAFGVPPGTVPDADGTAPGLCPRHGSTVFVRRADHAWRCLKCRAEAVSERRRRVKAQLVAEAGGACVLCGYDACVAALQFHHRDPAQKRFTVARAVTLSLETLRAEARKCVLLCSNCHAEVEAGVASLPS